MSILVTLKPGHTAGMKIDRDVIKLYSFCQFCWKQALTVAHAFEYNMVRKVKPFRLGILNQAFAQDPVGVAEFILRLHGLIWLLWNKTTTKTNFILT